jgi:hypothetical protein
MQRLWCTAQFVAALALSGCGTVGLFGEYDLPEDPAVEAAPWPRLVDTPTAPPVGEYTDAVPDPTRGEMVNRRLTAEAAVAAVRAGELAGPVIPEEEREELFRRARRRQP